MSDDKLYIALRSYLRGAIGLEVAALTGRAPTVSPAQRERLADAVRPAFTGKRKDIWQRAIDSIARTAAERALGMPGVADSVAEEIFDWKAAAAMREYADKSAKQLLKESKTTEARSAMPDVRELVKAEVTAGLRDMHRGIWKEGKLYDRGQMATRDGSVWLCQTDRARGTPGQSPDWLLIVKHGENARRR